MLVRDFVAQLTAYGDDREITFMSSDESVVYPGLWVRYGITDVKVYVPPAGIPNQKTANNVRKVRLEAR